MPRARDRGVAPAAAAAAAILAAALAYGPTGGAAQAIEGVLVDPDRDRGIAGALVVRMDTALADRDSTTTDDAGRFHLDVPGPGTHFLRFELPGYLTLTDRVDVAPGETREIRVEMPLISGAAAAVMRDAIDREAAFQLPLHELCREPLRPWEAGVLVGVTRDRRTLEPVGRVLVTLEVPDAPGDSTPSPHPPPPRSRLSTDSGAYWFCNVPAGRVRLVARGEGLPPDTSYATIRAGTISWSDALLGRRR